GDRGVRAPSEDFGAAWVDRIDLAGETVLHEEAHDAAAELVLAVGGAEDGDGARMQDPFEVDARAGAIGHGGGMKGLCHVSSGTIPPLFLDGRPIAPPGGGGVFA